MLDCRHTTNLFHVMVLISSAFSDSGPIPKKYTCDGEDISPPLSWEAVPGDAKSLVLICDDPDAPAGTWVHWVLFNLPPETTFLPASFPADPELPTGARQGMTDFRRVGYGGPCPPGGTHRYFFKLYALDAMLGLEAGATKWQVVKAMQGHILAETQLMGKYKR